MDLKRWGITGTKNLLLHESWSHHEGRRYLELRTASQNKSLHVSW